MNRDISRARYAIPDARSYEVALNVMVAPPRTGPTTKQRKGSITIDNKPTNVTIINDHYPLTPRYALTHLPASDFPYEHAPNQDPIDQKHLSVYASLVSYLYRNATADQIREKEFALSLDDIMSMLEDGKILTEDGRKHRNRKRVINDAIERLRELSDIQLRILDKTDGSVLKERYITIQERSIDSEDNITELKFRLNDLVFMWLKAAVDGPEEIRRQIGVWYERVPVEDCRHNLQTWLATKNKQFRSRRSYPVSLADLAGACGLSDDLTRNPKRAINKIIKETNAWAAANDQKAAIEGDRIRLTRNGQSKKQQGRSLNVGQVKAIIEAIQQASGLSKNEIAKQMGCSGGTISKMLKEARTGKTVGKGIVGKLKTAFPDEVKRVAKW